MGTRSAPRENTGVYFVAIMILLKVLRVSVCKHVRVCGENGYDGALCGSKVAAQFGAIPASAGPIGWQAYRFRLRGVSFRNSSGRE